jgi:hypothetical protein
MRLASRHPMAGKIVQRMQHIENSIVPVVQKSTTNLTFQYIHNLITKEVFIRKLKSNDKYFRMGVERNNLIGMYVQIVHELLVRMFQEYSDDLVEEYQKLAEYCQEKYDEINQSYGSKKCCKFIITEESDRTPILVDRFVYRLVPRE